MIKVEINNQQIALAVDTNRLRAAVAMVLQSANVATANVSLAIVDDPTMHRLNRRYLDHDYPTDVLSFLLEQEDDYLEGEVIVSADTARRTALEVGWPADDELLLYVIHGTLHLVGVDDRTEDDRRQMREREQAMLRQLNVASPPAPRDAPSSSHGA